MTHPAIRKESVAVITGAAMGIGFAIAKRLCQEGMHCVLFDKNESVLNNAKNQLLKEFPNTRLLCIVGDVVSEQAIQALYQQSINFGDVSMLINNAAIGESAGPWWGVDKWYSIMDINFWSLLKTQHFFVEHFLTKSSHSAIVNLGSKEGITTPPGNAAYSVSKAATKVLTEQLSHEFLIRSANHITAHLLIPGYTFTPMNFPDQKILSEKPVAPWSADQVADRMIEGMSHGDFYIFCEDNEVSPELDRRRIQWAADDMILNRPALSRWHPDYADKFKAFIGDLDMKNK